MFPTCCRDGCGLEELLNNTRVTGATVNKQERVLELKLAMPAPPAPVDISTIEREIGAALNLAKVCVFASYPRQEAAKPKSNAGKVIMGHPPKRTPEITPIRDLNLDTGRCVVEGQVIDVTSREIPKAGAWVLTFDMTDKTGSVHVTRFMKDENAKEIVDAIVPGITVQVGGCMEQDRFYLDPVLAPNYIVFAEPAPARKDTADEKRVELHLHTTMSNMDALTDTKAVVKRAISWGHPAIAITDHGVVQSFPDAMKAAGDKIKILYGLEGYYINDMDDKLAVCGPVTGSLDEEIVVFDIETTGLSSQDDRITEIGAVLLRRGEEVDRYQTFVDPGCHIPAEITNLTGITDDMVRGAPGQEQAVREFLQFVGGRAVAAHNAGFDVGFIYEACQRYGIDYTPAYVDTLALARTLMPELKNHKLDTVANKLSLPQFNHHRASDDAVTAGLILSKMMLRLKKAGIEKAEAINDYLCNLRQEAAMSRRFKPKHIIILVRTQAGIKNLYKIVTDSHLKYFHRYPIVPKSLLTKYRDGLIIGSACEAGEIFGLIADHRSRLEQRRLAEFYDYLEIQPICNNRFMLRGDNPRAKDEEELRNFNRRVLELGDELGKPVVATCDVHFLDPEDEIFRHVLLTAKGFDDADESLPIYFRTTDEMLEEFAYLGQDRAREVVITNTRAIADSCEVVRPLPPEILYPPKIERSAEQLKELVFGRMHELYGDNPPEIVTKRLDTELSGILGRGYDVIYMSAQKLVADSLAHGYLVGSRGSVGSSLVAYMSGITEVNSLPSHYRCPRCQHVDFEAGESYGCGADMPDGICPECGTQYKKEGFSIPFETFLGFGGDKVPDIDLNFSGEYQANAHKYTNTLFGPEHVFRAGTIGTVAEKTAYGYVKKYMEITGKTCSLAEMNRLAKGCVGVKRTTGQHPGGLVVIPQDMEITDFCPAQHPADDAESDIITTHFEYHDYNDNLLKFDILGHVDPTAMRLLEKISGIDVKTIPMNDVKVLSLFNSSKALDIANPNYHEETGAAGLPEFGTLNTRRTIVETRPALFSDLVQISGLSHGTDVWQGNAQELIRKGIKLSDVIGCRDDIMGTLMSYNIEARTSFGLMEKVRKGKGLTEEEEKLMLEHDVPAWYIESCKKIKYMFPKAHAVAYCIMAVRVAWFKVYYPAYYYVSYFTLRCDAYELETMMKDADSIYARMEQLLAKKNYRGPDKNMKATKKEEDIFNTIEVCYEMASRGLRMTNINLNKSLATEFRVDPDNDKLIIPPFKVLDGLGDNVAESIVKAREEMEFISKEDLMSRTQLSNTLCKKFEDLGVLNELADTNQLSLF